MSRSSNDRVVHAWRCGGEHRVPCSNPHFRQYWRPDVVGSLTTEVLGEAHTTIKGNCDSIEGSRNGSLPEDESVGLVRVPIDADVSAETIERVSLGPPDSQLEGLLSVARRRVMEVTDTHAAPTRHHGCGAVWRRGGACAPRRTLGTPIARRNGAPTPRWGQHLATFST